MMFDTGPLTELAQSLKLCLKDNVQSVEFSGWVEILLFMTENVALKLDRNYFRLSDFSEQSSNRFENLTDGKLAEAVFRLVWFRTETE